eukprot:TRINITY_DN3646_c0_g1_i1.p1 TRINITY_DN3646_c0_g1~~TRINITY_DN3646_c0_g1_i1.p1  ORF type:complete len:607 (-),score=315.38 TRINITY_DN3646_c0_g1_i1:17-1771(-)
MADGNVLTVEEKIALIRRNLQEVIEPSLPHGGNLTLESIISQRDLSLYWGTATTGRPHIAYFVPMTKIADFLRAGCEVTILFADLHGYLDNMKSTWELLEYRVQHYQRVIKAMLKSIGVPIEKLKFVKGSDYQLSREYTLDVYRSTTITTERMARKAGADVVKQVEHPLLSGMLYPLLQALDEEYLKVDAQFGGVDQRKIFTLSQDLLPRLGYKTRIHLMNSMVPGLTGKKMSASDPASKIDILESRDSIQKKLKRAYCKIGEVEDNGVLAFAQFVGFPVLGLQGKPFVINRPEKWGGPITYNTYAELHAAYEASLLAPEDLKLGILDLLNMLLDPIREEFNNDPEWQRITREAYPDNEAGEAAAHAAAAAASSSSSSSAEGAAPAAGAAQKKKGGNAAPKKQAQAQAPKADRPVDCSRLDLRVGKIVEITPHATEPDRLYTVKVDVGEAEARWCVAGLVPAIPIDQLRDRLVVVVCNLKAANFKGVLSAAMILAASKDDKIETIDPPADSAVGDRISFPGYEGEPEKELNNKKTNLFRKIQPSLFTNDQGQAFYKGADGKPDALFTAPKGVCGVPSVFSASIQ